MVFDDVSAEEFRKGRIEKLVKMKKHGKSSKKTSRDSLLMHYMRSRAYGCELKENLEGDINSSGCIYVMHALDGVSEEIEQWLRVINDDFHINVVQMLLSIEVKKLGLGGHLLTSNVLGLVEALQVGISGFERVAENSNGISRRCERSRDVFYKDLVKVIDILKITNARGFVGILCIGIEEMVLNLVYEKHLVLLHGKIILVSCEDVEKRVTHSKRELRRVSLKCYIDEYKPGFGWRVVAKVLGKAGENILQKRDLRGAKNLIQKLENHSMNVKIQLLSSNFFQDMMMKYELDDAFTGLQNCKGIESFHESVSLVEILRLFLHRLLMILHKVPNCGYVEDFLRNIASVWEKLKKVGTVGAKVVEKAALHDRSKEVSSSSPLKFDKIVEDDTLPRALTQVNGDDQPMDFEFEEYSILEKEISSKNFEFSNTDAVTECRGINDSPHPSSTAFSGEPGGGEEGAASGAAEAIPLSFAGAEAAECEAMEYRFLYFELI
ncbi:hypothetical protein BUALT_Bualt06G0125300 [Buddleja alternifolia]|uniref:Uncharacterized protein n=1 Tax=Buddleja alternifolia TaxID=168488 RepID=A0AAV6XEU1_9LAMI|nr:hypothetical protein BUALT_Bualt06G0125300 [Buddleja alternifolia]